MLCYRLVSAGEAVYFEDIRVGEEYSSPGRTVTEADIVIFAGLSGDYNVLHTDAEHMKASLFGERIAHGLLGLSALSGLMMEMDILKGTVEAFLGLTWRFTGPIRFGDEVRGEIAVQAKRLSRKGQGIVTFDLKLKNQKDETVQEGEFTLMVRRRGAEPPRMSF